MHTYIWDLDRTYLQTDIRSVRGLVRSAWETASDKQTVPGADTLVRALLDADADATLTFVSGSPVQMREVLEAKLALDGVRVDRLVLKDNLRNLTRGRFRAVRGQLGYKLPRLLAHRLGQPAHTTESLFGDDAEVDALIYALYAEVLSGRVDEDGMVRLLRAGGAYDDQVEHAVRSLARVQRADVVDGIYIRVDEGVPLSLYRLLGRPVHVVFDWFQAALALHGRGRLTLDAVAAVATATTAAHPWGWGAMPGWVQDAVRRGLVDADTAHDALGHDAFGPVRARASSALTRVGPKPPATDAAPPTIDRWAAFLSGRAALPG